MRDHRGEKAIHQITGVLEHALDTGADSVSLEYEDGGMEVCFNYGNTGIGTLIDRKPAREVVGYMWEAAKLETKFRGKMQMKLHGKDYAITAER